MRREQLYRRRIERKLTQAEVAKRVNIARTAYTRIERGYRKPNVEIAIRIAHVLGCRVEDIFLPNDVTDRLMRFIDHSSFTPTPDCLGYMASIKRITLILSYCRMIKYYMMPKNVIEFFLKN